MATRSTALARARAATRAARLVAPVAALAVVVAGVAGPRASTAASAAPTRTIEQVQAEIDALEHDAADAAEAWNEARTRQGAIEKSIATLKVRIAAAKAAYGKIASAVDDMARAAYASGGMEPSLQALLADDPERLPRAERRARPGRALAGHVAAPHPGRAAAPRPDGRRSSRRSRPRPTARPPTPRRTSRR